VHIVREILRYMCNIKIDVDIWFVHDYGTL